nr:deleted in malignant brain tumors 1 protein-like [Danio rerio]|eukprot:XP_021327496.1 deleted in malignant brain tumors 1 protein-like [Danio rerio]
MILNNIRALTVVCWIMCVRSTVSQAPTLNFPYSVNPNKVALNTPVQFSCNIPRYSPYPMTVSIGKLENSSQTPESTVSWLTSEVIHSGSMYFTIPAVSQYEGKLVCWYKSTKTSLKKPYSEFSNPVDFIVSALSPPNITVNPDFFLEGGNYTVSCNITPNTLTNYTMSQFYRYLPFTPANNWTLLGSSFLTDISSTYSSQKNMFVPVEFACSTEMVYNGKVLHSPLATKQAIPESLPVQLWEQRRGESCMGYLNINLKFQWRPVCQKPLDTEAVSQAAATTASVVCRDLGCGHMLNWQRLSDSTRLFTNTIGDIKCSGKENKIKDCSLNVTESCKEQGTLFIVCSDAMPRPKLSVFLHGPVSKLYVTDKQDVELVCSINSTLLKTQDYGYYIFRKNGQVFREIYTQPQYLKSVTLSAPVEGQYECAFQLDSSKIKQVSQPSNNVFIYIYNPPATMPIVAGVLTTLIGTAILVYICVCRTAKEEVPAHPQDPETAQISTENSQNNADYLPQQM